MIEFYLICIFIRPWFVCGW